MTKICVFAGTTEGRELIEFLKTQPVSIYACVATEYGRELLEPSEHLEISADRMTEEQMEALFQKEKFSIVIDGTHPYASLVTENISTACRHTNTPYLRLLRASAQRPEEGIWVPDGAAAAQYLESTQGNILLTTGSKELKTFSSMENFAGRVYARVLPMEESLRLCREAGLEPSHILAMQGPFSRTMNEAMLQMVSASYLVTKESGAQGGFPEKLEAARAMGVTPVIIGRPVQKPGKSYEEVLEFLCQRFGFSPQPLVTVAGIGPGAREHMTLEVLSQIENAQCIIGAERMIRAAAQPHQAVFTAIAPEKIAEMIHTHPQYTRFLVAMSGDTGFYSGTKKLLPLLKNCRVQVLPGLHTLSYFCSRLGISYEDVVPVSLHGRSCNILWQVKNHRRVFTLVGGENGLGNLCRQLCKGGLGDVQVKAGQDLGYPQEVILEGTAAELADRKFSSLSAALLENPKARHFVTPGIPDAAFQRKSGEEGVVPMTKSEIRALCLSKLRPEEDSLCWDVGAGTGSVAIELAMLCGNGTVYAVEKKPEALELLRENCRKFGADNVQVVSGLAPEACQELPAPTHVFIGGSSGNIRQILHTALCKNPQVRIVATAIALETVSALTEAMKDSGFSNTEAVCLSVAKARKAGPYHLMSGQNPIYIFTMQGGETQ